MYKSFCSSLETVIKKHAPQKTVFIRHDKPKLTLHQQWILQNTVKNLQRYQNVLKQENEKHLLDVFQISKSARERLNSINEIRICEKTQTEKPRLKNSFGTVLTNGNDIANLLNFKFSALGKYFGKNEQYQFCNNARHSNKFVFRYTTTRRYLIYSTI